MASVRDTKKLIDTHHSLKQDFDDLFRETQALKAKLEGAKRRKSRLVSEVRFGRFLRRRRKLLSSKPLAVNIKWSINEPPNLETSTVKKSKEEGVTSRRNHALLDLNKVSEQDCEEVQVVWVPLRLNKATKPEAIESADPLANDLKLSIWRGIGKGIGSVDVAERAAKRKISWQDQVALRV